MSCQPLLPFQETLQKLRGTQWVSCARNIRTVAHFWLCWWCPHLYCGVKLKRDFSSSKPYFTFIIHIIF